jgi:hypothetical protein
VVSEAALHHELRELKLQLARFNRTLAIPIENLNIYYTTPLASCTIDKTNISNVHIFLRVPTHQIETLVLYQRTHSHSLCDLCFG